MGVNQALVAADSRAHNPFLGSAESRGQAFAPDALIVLDIDGQPVVELIVKVECLEQFESGEILARGKISGHSPDL